MRRILIATLALLAACGDIKDQKFTEAAFQKFKDSPETTESERSLAAGYMARHAFAQVTRGDTTPDFFDESVTIGEAIEAERTRVAADSARKAAERRAAGEARQRREAELARARGMVSVAVTGMSKRPRNAQAYRFNDVAVLSVALVNNGTQPVTGVKGRLVVRDVFGDEIIRLEYKHDDAIAPGARAVTERFYEINPYIGREVRLYQTDFDKLRISWEPQTLLLGDGTRLEVAEPVRDPLDILRTP
jgi:hypothetical protein